MRARCMLKENVENKLNMTREDQIAIASCAYGSRGSSIDFEAGAKWAGANPKQELVDLSQVWHPAEEVPTKEQPILYFTKNGKIAVLNRVDVEKWDWYLDKYSILLWCYTEDVLPKGDKKWAI